MRYLQVAAWTAVLAGCFASHGRGGDGPIDPDAGVLPTGCEDVEGAFEALECPETAPVGRPATVTVSHAGRLCCETMDPTVTATGRPGATTLRSRWRECDCCEGCRCAPAPVLATVATQPIVPGPNTVEAGGQRCVIEGLEDLTCMVVDAENIAPSVLFADQGFAFSLTHDEPADCICTPELAVIGTTAELSLCGCAGACDAVFVTYEASFEGPPLPVGRQTVTLAGRAHELRVVDPNPGLPGSGCRPIEADSVTVVGPFGTAPGPRLVWALIEVTQPVCCSPSVEIAARTLSSGPGAIEVQPWTCTVEDCICGTPIPMTGVAAHNLGELAPGDYSLTVGDLRTRFVVR